MPASSVALIDWSPYSWPGSAVLAALLVVVGVCLVLLVRRRSSPIAFPIPSVGAKIAIVLVWVVSILLVRPIFQQVALETGQSALGTGPVFPITLTCVLGAFLFVAYTTRRGGTLAALGNGFAAAVAGPMVFELPYVLIITPQVTTRVPHPFFLFATFLVVIITTLALPTFSSRFSLNRLSVYSLAGMFVVFALWAVSTGYAPPADPTSFALNAVSKVLGFLVVALGFGSSPRTSSTTK